MRFLAPLFACILPMAALADDVTTYSLHNGMEVVVIEDHRAPVVVHMLWYKVGSADEPVGASGVRTSLSIYCSKRPINLSPANSVRRWRPMAGRITRSRVTLHGYFQRRGGPVELMMDMGSTA